MDLPAHDFALLLFKEEFNTHDVMSQNNSVVVCDIFINKTSSFIEICIMKKGMKILR